MTAEKILKIAKAEIGTKEYPKIVIRLSIIRNTTVERSQVVLIHGVVFLYGGYLNTLELASCFLTVNSQPAVPQ